MVCSSWAENEHQHTSLGCRCSEQEEVMEVRSPIISAVDGSGGLLILAGILG